MSQPIGDDAAGGPSSRPRRLRIAHLVGLALLVPRVAAAQASWWDTAYAYRVELTIATGATPVAAGYAVPAALDHAALVAAGKSLVSGDDVRVVYWDGVAHTELDRSLDSGTAWNSAGTLVWLKLQAAVAASGSSTAYYLYYGNPAPAAARANAANVFLFSDDFESGVLSKWTVVGGGAWGIDATTVHRGTKALMQPANSGSTISLQANPAIDVADLYYDVWWRTSDPTADVAQQARVSGTFKLEGAGTEHDAGGNVNIFKRTGSLGTWSLVAGPCCSPGIDVWYRMGFAISGTFMRAFKDGVEILAADGGSVAASGNLGFWANIIAAGKAIWIDDVVARPYVNPEPSVSRGAEVALCHVDADCGPCQTCTAGLCFYDASRNGDCPYCQKCTGPGVCGFESALEDLKNDCPTGTCVTGTCDGAGACGQQTAAQDVNNDCPPGPCATGTCNGAGACGRVAAGVSCADADGCNGVETCDGAGVCLPGTAVACATATTPPQLTVTAPPLVGSVTAPEAPLLRLTLEASAIEAVRVGELRLHYQGEGAAPTTQVVRLYDDRDGDGIVGPEDTLLGEAAGFSVGVIAWTPGVVIDAGASAHWLLTRTAASVVASGGCAQTAAPSPVVWLVLGVLGAGAVRRRWPGRGRGRLLFFVGVLAAVACSRSGFGPVPSVRLVPAQDIVAVGAHSGIAAQIGGDEAIVATF